MSVRTYNPSVRVGNWSEDIKLEEDTLKDFLERKERGELLMQRTASLKGAMASQISLSISREGTVHFGDIVTLINPGDKAGTRKPCALSVNKSESSLNQAPGEQGPCSVSASTNVQPSSRDAFIITSIDGTPSGQTLTYGQPFAIVSSEGQFLHSDKATFQKSAKKSRHNEVSLVSQASHLTEWRILSFDPLYRMELENSPVPANTKVIINHMKTNQDLCLEEAYTLRTPFGREFEVTAFTKLDSHRAEEDVNHWMIVMNVPGDTVMSVQETPAPAPVSDTMATQ